MKFKTIFIIFNIVIIFSFIFIALMPLFILGYEYASVFWANNWILGLIFVLIIVFLNIYFGYNWQLFQLLESEDWPKLMEFLEGRLYNKKRVRDQYIRILINTYFVQSKVDEIEKLETFLSNEAPRQQRKHAVVLGIPKLLRNDPEEMEQYYGAFLGDKAVRGLEWIRWNYAFSLLLKGDNERVKQELLTLVSKTRNNIVFLLSVYLLSSMYLQEGERQKVTEARNALKKRYTRESLDKEVHKHSDDLQVVIMLRLIDEAKEWLLGNKSENAAGKESEKEITEDKGEPDNNTH